MDLVKGLGTLRVVLASPARLAQIDQVHDHEPRSARESIALQECRADALEILRQQRLTLRVLCHGRAHSPQQRSPSSPQPPRLAVPQSSTDASHIRA